MTCAQQPPIDHKERPILFNAPMVCAILKGRKTVTRRTMKVQPVLNGKLWQVYGAGWSDRVTSIPAVPGHSLSTKCPYGTPGDRMWVRETWSDVNLQGAPGIAYRADDDIRDLMEDESFLDERGAFNYDDPRSKPYPFACWSEDLIAGTEGHWRPSIHMPRWACRILLEITDVSIERLQDITPAQVTAEGVSTHGEALWGVGWWVDAPDQAIEDARKDFADLWTSTGGDWAANPWVWVIEFKRVMP